MKKLLLIPAMLGTMALASDYNYEVTPVLGYNIAEGNLNLDNAPIGGLELQFNDVDSNIKPELSILHSSGVDSVDLSPTLSTKVTRFALNGVYEYAEASSFIPFAKAGFGYENMSNSVADNSDGVFVDAGAGVKVPFSDSLALKLEALYMLKHNDNTPGFDWGDSNLAVLAGLNYSFGKKAQKVAPVVAPVVAPLVIDGDDDSDGVLNSVDKCPGTVAYQPVNAEGCFVDGDDDKDGVLNSIDACPKTLAGKKVNAEGCFIDNDTDKDGVLNAADKCPGTPAGKTVNTNGCVADIDNDKDKDGILNANDICPNTPLGAAVNNDGCSKTVKLHVTFANNSSVINSNSYDEIEEYANFLSTYKNYSAKIVGHTDSLGKNDYNQWLSEVRAKSVMDMLIEKGAPASSLSYVGEGETNPIATNTTNQGRADNRRIEAELTRN